MTRALNWLKRPVPLGDESLAGFLGRWSRVNAMSSRVRLLQALGISRSIRIAPDELAKLAKGLGLELSVLQDIAPSDEPARPGLRRSLTRARDEAVCPECLKESSHSRQIWSHALATACPTHRIRLLDRCEKCGEGLSHGRGLPHLCGCGADLRLQKTETAARAETELAMLLMGAAPAEPMFPFAIVEGVPADLDLFFLGFANHFGSAGAGMHVAKAGKRTVPASVEGALARLTPAFMLLEGWPTAFDAGLQAMIERPPGLATTGVAQRLGRWYVFLLRRFAGRAYEPIRVAAANQIMGFHDGVLNARTHCVQSIATTRKTWYSVVEAARVLGVSADRLNDGIDRGLIRARIHDQAVGYRQRFIARQEIERLKEVRAAHLDEASARRLLDVPQSVFALMVEGGWIESANATATAPVTNGLVRRDALSRLIQRLKATSVNIVPPGVTLVRLRDLNLRRTTDRQRLVSLFRCIALGEVTPAVDDGGDGVGGLQFLQSELDARIASRIVARGLTVQQVSVLTSVHYDAVKGWVADGLLAATRQHQEQGAPWVIELQSLVTFLLTHTPLSTLASSCSTTSRGLSATLVRHGVLPLVPASKRGTLVKLSDAFSAMGQGEIADCPIAGKQTLKSISPEVLPHKKEYQPVPGAPDG